jgi:PilZ domain
MPNKRESSGKSGARAAAQERRTGPRYVFSALVEAVHLQADTRLSGRVSDLSKGGCYVDTINPFPVGADVKIRIVRDNLSFVAMAQVFYAMTGFGMGLGFTKIEPERQAILDRWLAELSGESLREVKALEDDEPVAREASAESEARFVLNELIVTLMRKQMLTEPEGKAMLKKLKE